MQNVSSILSSFIERIGRLSSWLSIALVLMFFLDVLLRYCFNFTLIWIIELEKYVFAFLFLFSLGFALKHNKHVRVDVFYAQFSKVNKNRVDLIGTIIFLIPWCIIVIVTGFKYAALSFKIKESSAQPGGLPALYILKFAIVIGFVLLLMQGIASIMRWGSEKPKAE